MKHFNKVFGVALLAFLATFIFSFSSANLALALATVSKNLDIRKHKEPKKPGEPKPDPNPDTDDENDDQSSQAEPKIDGPFIIRPYLFSLKGEKIAVAWSYKDKNSIKDVIDLKITQGGVAQSLTPVIDQNLFVVELPIAVCDFSNDISYEVTGMKKAQHINVIPCPGHMQNTTRFTFMADTQEGTEYAHQFALQAEKFNGSAFLLGGDLVQTGTELREWVALFDALDPVLRHQALVPAVGNHEYRHDNTVPLWKYFFRAQANENYYATDIGDAHVIALNSCFIDDPSMRVKQLAWLDNELAKPARWRIIFFHHPAYSKGILNNEHYPKKEYLVLQEDYLPLFEKYGVDLVLNGHTHIFEHSVKDGINYITTGPAGGRLGLYGAKNPYSLKADRIRTMVELEVSNQALRAVTTTIEGKTIDEVILNKK